VTHIKFVIKIVIEAKHLRKVFWRRCYVKRRDEID